MITHQQHKQESQAVLSRNGLQVAEFDHAERHAFGPKLSRTTGWLILLGILLVAAGLRFWRITSLPPGFYLDEAFEGLGAWRILTDPTYRPIFLSGYSTAL